MKNIFFFSPLHAIRQSDTLIQHFPSEGLFYCISRQKWDLILELSNGVLYTLKFRVVLPPEKGCSRGIWNTLVGIELRFLFAVRQNLTLDGLGNYLDRSLYHLLMLSGWDLSHPPSDVFVETLSSGLRNWLPFKANRENQTLSRRGTFGLLQI